MEQGDLKWLSWTIEAIELTALNPTVGGAKDGNHTELLCPVRALKGYLRATENLRHSDQLFICYGEPKKGQPKQRLSHWVVGVIIQAYKVKNLKVPAGIWFHSTIRISTSWAALKGVPLIDICAAANWSSADTYSRYYRVNVVTSDTMERAVLLGSSTPG